MASSPQSLPDQTGIGNKTKRASALARSLMLIWLGREYVNGTFTDEDIQNVDDIEEIQKLLDDTSEDELCSE